MIVIFNNIGILLLIFCISILYNKRLQFLQQWRRIRLQNYNKKLFDKYSNFFYPYRFYEHNVFMNEVPVSTDVGYIELFVFTDQGRVPIKGAYVTFYARKGDVNKVPVKRVSTETNPIIVELPVAHPKGTLIRGPEYYFTTYDMTIEKEGYYSITVLNIRMFPGITTQFSYNLNRVLPGTPGRQETIAIPPHPRDEIIAHRSKNKMLTLR